jgi:hypothetical protein
MHVEKQGVEFSNNARDHVRLSSQDCFSTSRTGSHLTKHAARLRCKLAGCGAEGDRERETNLCIQEGKIIRKKSNYSGITLP